MPVESSPSKSVELPGLIASRLSLISANLLVSAGSPDLTLPQLILEGDDEDFEHSFQDGRLDLNEKPSGGSNVTIISTRGARGVSIGRGSFSGIMISGSSIIINGREIIGNSAGILNPVRRKASLLLPFGYDITSHNIENMSGGVELDSITAHILKIASQSGDVAVRATMADALSINTMSGDVEIEETKSTNAAISAVTMSGDIGITGSEAPLWSLSTMSGDIKVKATLGEVDAKSMSGRTRISA